MRTAQRRNYSQTCDSGTPAFPSLRLQVQHEWFLNCCPCEAYTSCPLSNRLKNQLLSRKVKYTICKILRFTTRAVKAPLLSLCQPESDRALSHLKKVADYSATKMMVVRAGTRRVLTPSISVSAPKSLPSSYSQFVFTSITHFIPLGSTGSCIIRGSQKEFIQ